MPSPMNITAMDTIKAEKPNRVTASAIRQAMSMPMTATISSAGKYPTPALISMVNTALIMPRVPAKEMSLSPAIITKESPSARKPSTLV